METGSRALQQIVRGQSPLQPSAGRLLRLLRSGRVGTCASAGLLLAYFIVIARSPAVGLGDTSNHLARAYIMADLLFHHGAQFGPQFQYHFLAIPYVLLDLLVAVAIQVLGARVAVVAWTVVTFVSVPAALFLYLRVTVGLKSKQLLKEEATWFLLLCAAYLSTDFFFVVGFFAFKLAVACVIVIISLIEMLRRRWTSGLFLLYSVLLVAGYLIHLTTLVFVAAIVAVSAVLRLWFRISSLRHELLLFVPIAAIFAWHFGVATHYAPPADVASAIHSWGTIHGKAVWLARNYHRYGGRMDSVLLYLYVASLVLLIRTRDWRAALANPRVVELLALTATFLAIYLVLPFSLGDATYVDIRALAPAALFILLGCLALPGAERTPKGVWTSPRVPVLCAFVLSALNVAYLGRHFEELSRWSTQVRSLFANIPRGARVLPVQTRPDMWLYVDPSPMVLIDHRAMIPYLFSADTDAPQLYFRYVHYPYAPPDDWYTKDSSEKVDWRQVACNYQYILVTRPFDLVRFRIATDLVAENSSAALLAIRPRECPGITKSSRS